MGISAMTMSCMAFFLRVRLMAWASRNRYAAHQQKPGAAPRTEPADAGGFSDPVARAVIELQEIQRKLESTRWEWSNRDEQAKLKRRASELEALQRELATTSWRWSNRDRGRGRGEQPDSVSRRTLARIRALRAPAPATQKP